VVATPARRTRNLTASMAPPFVRHLLILGLAAAGTFALALVALPHEQPAYWVVAGLAGGLITSLLARGMVGFVVLALGHLIGIGLEYQWRPEGWPTTTELLASGPIHVAVITAAGVAYALVRMGRPS
jgi:hypothetical protein